MSDEEKSKEQLLAELATLRSRIEEERERAKEREASLNKARIDAERRVGELEAAINAIADGVAIFGPDGELIRINPMASYILNHVPEKPERLSREMIETLGVRTLDGEEIPFEDFPLVKAFRGDTVINQTVRLRRPVGRAIYISVSTAPIRYRGEFLGVVATFTNITRRLEMAEELKKARDSLELRVRERTLELAEKTQHLEEVNAALRVLLRQRDEDRKEFEETILANVRNLVVPYLERLKKSRLDKLQETLLGILESHLHEITSGFSRRLTFQYSTLTPTEIRVAAMVRDGKSTKEIAEALNISGKSVSSHRDNIRGKLGLRGKRSNLRTYLLSIT